jgi:hypothetical protein
MGGVAKKDATAAAASSRSPAPKRSPPIRPVISPAELAEAVAVSGTESPSTCWAAASARQRERMVAHYGDMFPSLNQQSIIGALSTYYDLEAAELAMRKAVASPAGIIKSAAALVPPNPYRRRAQPAASAAATAGAAPPPQAPKSADETEAELEFFASMFSQLPLGAVVAVLQRHTDTDGRIAALVAAAEAAGAAAAAAPTHGDLAGAARGLQRQRAAVDEFYRQYDGQLTREEIAGVMDRSTDADAALKRFALEKAKRREAAVAQSVTVVTTVSDATAAAVPTALKLPDCVVCLHETASCAYIPCGHMAICATCKPVVEASSGNRKCPVCASAAYGTFRIYF